MADLFLFARSWFCFAKARDPTSTHSASAISSQKETNHLIFWLLNLMLVHILPPLLYQNQLLCQTLVLYNTSFCVGLCDIIPYLQNYFLHNPLQPKKRRRPPPFSLVKLYLRRFYFFKNQASL